MTAPITAPIEVRFRATGVSAVQQGLRLVGDEAESSGHRTANAFLGISQGIQQISRAGEITGRSMKELVENAGNIAFAFGPEGAIIGGIALIGEAIYTHITRGFNAASEAATKFGTEIGTLANSGDVQGLLAKAKEIQFGQPFDEKGNLRQPSAVPGAFAGSLADLESKKQFLESKLLPAGFLTNDIANQGIFKAIKDLTPDLEKARDAFRQVKTAIDVIQSQRPSGPLAAMHTEAGVGMLPEDFTAAVTQAAAQLAAEEARNQIPGMPSLVSGGVATGIPDMLGGPNGFRTFDIKAGGDLKTMVDALAKRVHDELTTPLGDAISRDIGQGIGDALTVGFTAAFQTGNIGDGMKAALGGILSTMGEIFIQIGEKALLGMAFISQLAAALTNPAVGIPVAIGLIALGAGLRMEGAALGGASGVGGFSGSSFAARAPAAAAGPTVVPSRSMPNLVGIGSTAPVTVNATIIGTKDPQAGRQLLEMINTASKRAS